MRTQIKLIALDMDGTLYNNQSQISDINQITLRHATAQGIEVVISTGRPYAGLPIELLGTLRHPLRDHCGRCCHLPPCGFFLHLYKQHGTGCSLSDP